jgi:hypothetical protein
MSAADDQLNKLGKETARKGTIVLTGGGTAGHVSPNLALTFNIFILQNYVCKYV